MKTSFAALFVSLTALPALATQTVANCKLENLPARAESVTEKQYVVAGSLLSGDAAKVRFYGLKDSGAKSKRVFDAFGNFHFEEVSNNPVTYRAEGVSSNGTEIVEYSSQVEVCMSTTFSGFKCQTVCKYEKKDFDYR